MVAIIHPLRLPPTRLDGTPCETIIAQAALPLETCNAVILNEAIYDTAVSADYVEGLLFGSDTN